MPDMINRHSYHSSVVVNNKLFVIGHEVNTCEVFDNVLKRFVSLKHPITITYNKCVAIGNRIVVLQKFSSSVICYDVDKDAWSKEFSDIERVTEDFSCIKIPQY